MSEKQLQSTVAAAAHQKEWFSDLRTSVFEKGRPYALVQADMPLELFHVMDVPVVVNQWWAAIVAAKRAAPFYLDQMNARGFHKDLCRYCSVSLATTLSSDRSQAPWGGLPKPSLIAARLTCDCIQRVFSELARHVGSEFVTLDVPGATDLPPRWWELSRHRWNELFEENRLRFMVSRFNVLIKTLERFSPHPFDPDRLRQLMERINQQEEYFDEVRQLICNAPYVPVRMHEQIANVMATQWERGSGWAVDHARAFRDEVRSRVELGIAACKNERVRLMWVGAGLWHDTAFYTAFEEEFGAVFAWSMYLAFGPDGYIRYGLEDPLLALASRVVSMNEQLHNPPWANEWIVDQALKHRIDAAIVLHPLGTRPSMTGTLFIERALRQAGIEVLSLEADMVDARTWDGERARGEVGDFLRTLSGVR
jgi:benzoyl-CoA reductase subunit B